MPVQAVGTPFPGDGSGGGGGHVIWASGHTLQLNWPAMAEAYLGTREHGDELKLPGVHLVKAWQNRPPTVAVDREHRGIVPGIPSTMAHMAGRERLPALDMGGPTGEGGQAQGFLPGLEPERTALVPALPLAVWDGKRDGNPGGGVPLSQGLWLEAVTAVPRSERGRRTPPKAARAGVLAVLDALDALAPGPDRTGEPDR